MPHRAGGGLAPGRAGAGGPAATPRFPLGGREGEEPPTGGTAGGTFTCRSAATAANAFALAQAEPPPMNMGGEAEHRGPDARGTTPRWPGRRTAEPAGRMTRYSAAGGLLERVWPWWQPRRVPCCRRTAASRSPPGLAPQGRPDDEPRDSSQGLHRKGYGHARACGHPVANGQKTTLRAARPGTRRLDHESGRCFRDG